MQISSGLGALKSAERSSVIKPLYTEKISKDEIKEIKAQISKNANAVAFNSTSVQGAVLSSEDKFKKDYEEFKSFLSEIGYDGKPIADLSKEEAQKLVSEEGFFGVKKTSERIANFVINGAGGDEGMMRAGREGMLLGFKEAQTMWGDELPDISKETMAKAVEMVDKAMVELGFSIIDTEA